MLETKTGKGRMLLARMIDPMIGREIVVTTDRLAQMSANVTVNEKKTETESGSAKEIESETQDAHMVVTMKLLKRRSLAVVANIVMLVTAANPAKNVREA